MKSKIKLTGAVLALGAAAIFTVAPVIANAHSHMVHCYGMNSCKGKGMCKTAHNSCKGKNSCKGQGMMKMSAKKCKMKGGTMEE